jgi:ketosteroid isomerase-like protein
MDALALLQAEKACRNLILAAADAVDQQAYETLVQLFTPDAVLVRPGGVELRGRAEILTSYASKDPNRLTHHLVCNHQVRVTPSGVAESRCKVLLYVSDLRQEVTPQGRLTDRKHQVGTIVDALVLTDAGWRIHRRNAWFDLFSSE